MADCFIDKIKT